MPLLTVYRGVVRCLTEPENEEEYRRFLEGLDKQGKHLAKEDLRKCYFIAQNYCALKINQGKREYYREMFDVFKKIIQKEILLEEETLSEGIFKNIVTVGLGVGAFEWIEQFIEEYAPYLPASTRENARTFNLAYLFFYQKKYSNVIELLQNVEYSDVTYVLGSKLILIQTYYELQEVFVMDSLIDSFRIFIRRNKVLSKNLKREYINYLSFVKKLADLRLLGQKATETFKGKIQASSSSTSKKWLLEKIDELQKN